ncbi:MAG: hypothetical protein IKY83_04525 [Proteobacteria bacterium]|nr:hypothetical protein [Pseudomonadota bacterium]
MKRNYILAALLSLPCALSACTEAQPPECVSTDSNICAGTATLITCKDNKWLAVPCPYGSSCTNGTCVQLPPDTPYIPACGASDKPVCAGPNAVRSCINGSWQTTPCEAQQICSDGVCLYNTVDVPECSIADIPVCEGTNAARTCYNGTWVPSPCAAGYACSNGKCEQQTQTPQECTVADLPVCEGTNAIRSCVNGKWQTSACPTGQTCASGICKTAEPTPECTAADIPVCEGTNAIRSCVNNTWQTSACPSGQTCASGICKAAEPTPECTAADIPVCVGTEALKTCVNNKWQTSACPTGQTCASGICKAAEPTPECTVADLPACASSNSIKSCVNGKWQTAACPDAQTCTNGQCVAPQPQLPTTGSLADVGKACNINTFIDNCDNNQIIYCSDKGKIDSSDLCDLWLEYSDIDMRCHVINGIAGCIYEEDTCTSLSETLTCSNSQTPTEVHKGCGKAEDGNLYNYESFTRICSGDCEPGKGCVDIPESEKCDPAAFIEKCDNNQTVTCVNGKQVRTACPSTQICNEFPTRGIARCTAPTPCEVIGESVTCEYIPNGAGDDTLDYATVSICLPAQNGKNYAYQDTQDYCSYRCDPVRGCVTPVKDEGKSCDPDWFEQRCQNNGAVFCDPFSETVDVIYCKAGFTCLTEPDLDTNDSGCYDDVESLCTKSGDKKYQCSTSGNYTTSTEYICKKLSDNKLHYVFNDFDTCKNGCNDNTGRCK